MWYGRAAKEPGYAPKAPLAPRAAPGRRRRSGRLAAAGDAGGEAERAQQEERGAGERDRAHHDRGAVETWAFSATPILLSQYLDTDL